MISLTSGSIAAMRGGGVEVGQPGSCEVLAEPVADDLDIRLVHELTVAVVLAGDGDRLDTALCEAGPAELGVLVEALAGEDQDPACVRIRLVGTLRLGAERQEVLLPQALENLAGNGEAHADLRHDRAAPALRDLAHDGRRDLPWLADSPRELLLARRLGSPRHPAARLVAEPSPALDPGRARAVEHGEERDLLTCADEPLRH